MRLRQPLLSVVRQELEHYLQNLKQNKKTRGIIGTGLKPQLGNALYHDQGENGVIEITGSHRLELVDESTRLKQGDWN